MEGGAASDDGGGAVTSGCGCSGPSMTCFTALCMKGRFGARRLVSFFPASRLHSRHASPFAARADQSKGQNAPLTLGRHRWRRANPSMGKPGKKQRESQKPRRLPTYSDDGDGDDSLPSSAYDLPPQPREEEGGGGDEQARRGGGREDSDDEEEVETVGSRSKFDLYQESVQSPQGDISYLENFFRMYVGRRLPLHLQEDFCGTALLSTEWVSSDLRRTAVGLDLDLEALNWCLKNNMIKVGADGCSRISLFHGNVLLPNKAQLIEHKDKDLVKSLVLSDGDGDGSLQTANLGSVDLPGGRDIVCAFNYSCCCLQRRKDLVLYFKHALNALSIEGGIFVMDLYGGTSSECKLRLTRKISDFTYIWEQEEFDILNRQTRISLHFHLGKKQIMQHAFTYKWRLWSLPEIKDCLEEAGFESVHFWIREMPSTQLAVNAGEYTVDPDVEYEELSSFNQCDAWNAYIVGIRKRVSELSEWL